MPSLGNGGIETMLVNIVNEQVRIGHEVAIIFIYKSVYEKSLLEQICPQVYLYFVNRKFNSKITYRILSPLLIRMRFNPDIVHFPSLMLARNFFYKRPKEKWFFTQHNIEPQKDGVIYDKRFTAYIAISDIVCNKLNKLVPTMRNIVCYNSINMDKVSPKLHYGNKVLKVLSLGRMVFYYKAQDTILAALDILNKQHRLDFDFDFIGGGKDLDKAKSLCKEYSLKEKVHFLGNQDNAYILEHLKEYDLIVHASRNEGFGLTVIESIAAGIPILLSDIDAFQEISDKGRLATMFKVDSTEELAKGIIECVQDYKNKVSVAQLAQKEIYEKFSIQTMVRNLDRIYNL